MSKASNNQILYTVVVRNKNVILSEYAAATDSDIKGDTIYFQQSVNKVKGSNAKRSFQHDKYGFHILFDESFQFLVLTDSEFELRIAYACLDDLKTQFYSSFTQNIRDNSIAYALQNQFQKIQKFKIDYYNTPDSYKIKKVKQNLDHTKTIMMENLDLLLERGEKLDILVQNTESMLSVSTDMKRNATQIRRDMWRRNKKIIMLLLIFAVLVIVYVCMVIVCGFKMQSCF